MMSISGWIAEAILAALLMGTLVMTVRLDRALRVVRRDRAVFETLISNLGSATNSVKLGIQALRNEADRAAEQIERRSEDADKLATDLSFLIEAADRAGARLDVQRQAPAPSIRPQATETPVAVASDPAAAGSPASRSRAAKRPVSAAPVVESGDRSGGLRQLAGIPKRRPAVSVEPRASARQTSLDESKVNELPRFAISKVAQ